MAAPVDFIRAFIDLSGGQNVDASTYTIRDSESPKARNVRIDPLGPVAGRLGSAVQHDSGGLVVPSGGSVPSLPIRSLHRYYIPGGTDLLLGTVNDKLFAIDDLTDLDNNVATVHTWTDNGPSGTPVEIDQAWEMVTFKGWVFLTTATGVLYRTNGTYAEKVGVKASTPTEPVDSGDFVNGGGGWLPDGATVRYVATYVHRDGLGESPASDVLADTAPGAGGAWDVTVTVPASGKTAGDVVATRVYRELQTGSGSGPFYFVEEISADGGTITDDNADSVLPLGIPSRADLDRGEPLKGAFITEHQDRLWLGNLTERDDSDTHPNTIQFSDSNAPEQWVFDFGLTSRNVAGEPFTGAAGEHAGNLVVTTQNYSTVIVGSGREAGPQTVPDYQVVQLGKGPGSLSHRLIQKRDGALFMLNKQDLWVWQGLQARPISRFRMKKWLRDNVDFATATTGIGITTDTQYRASLPVTTSEVQKTLIYDTQADGFVVDDGYNVAAYAYLDGQADLGELWASDAAATECFLYKMDSGNTDFDPVTEAGVVITREHRTKDFVLGRRPGETVWLTRVLLDAQAAGTKVQIIVHLNQDKAEIPLKTIRLEAAVPVWDAFNWDGANWAREGNTYALLSATQTTVGERFGLTIKQEEDEDPFVIEMLGFAGVYKGILDRRLPE